MQLFEAFLRLLALAAGCILLLLMGTTVLDVVMRYWFRTPLASVWELTEFSMALIVFLGIAHCGWTGGHIAVDLFDRWLKRPSLRFLPALIAFIGAALFALIAVRAAVETTATISQVSNMLRWPHYPFRYTVAFGSAMLALVLAIQGFQSLRRDRTERTQ
jgi:TRAP-type C4-dicarboxylate transport system permease small subunit